MAEMSPVHDLGPFDDPAMVRRLVDDGMVLFFALDGLGQVSWIGRSSSQILGRDPEAMIGTNGLDLIHPDDQDVVVATLAETARNADERILAVLRVSHADGSWVTLEFGGIDLRDAEGNGTFLVWGRSYESAGRLLEFLGSLLAGADLGALLDQVVRWTDALAPFSHSVVLRWSPDDETYRAVAHGDLPPRLGERLIVEHGSTGPWGESVRTGRIFEAPVDDLPPDVRAAAVPAGLAAVWGLPVLGPNADRPDGLLVSWRSRPGPLLATHERHLREAARLCALAFEWERGHRDLVEAATTDALTGIANRAQLVDQVHVEPGRLAALLFCDLDDFKGLNDRHGHLVGDRVLQEVARRMKAAVRSGDLLVRLGGDEFAAWCPDLADASKAAAVAERLIHSLDEPIVVDGVSHRVRCSVGIALTGPDGSRGTDIESLLHRSDEALYIAKRAGKGHWAFHAG